jgi:hypothetical protein
VGDHVGIPAAVRFTFFLITICVFAFFSFAHRGILHMEESLANHHLLDERSVYNKPIINPTNDFHEDNFAITSYVWNTRRIRVGYNIGLSVNFQLHVGEKVLYKRADRQTKAYR